MRVPEFKIMSDPVHGFVSVPHGLLYDLVQTPEVQRLRRIRQLGVGYLVFPGAEHSRFGHALGAMALTRDALRELMDKGTPISHDEIEGTMAAALLHDVGHGPFSHTLERDLIPGFAHEDMSRVVMDRLRDRFPGRLDLAIKIFDNAYERPFFHQLISSQIDMDRLDYLRRDAFYTGVSEGVVGVNRIIKTMLVSPVEGGPDSRIAIQAKGAYAVENFIVARRLMYWQVYLHRAVIAGDHILRSIFRRVRVLGSDAPDASPNLMFFLQRDVDPTQIADPDVYRHYCDLDDTDILVSLKTWKHAADPILADLSRRFIDRDFLRVEFKSEETSVAEQDQLREATENWMRQRSLLVPETNLPDPSYYLTFGHSSHEAYVPKGMQIAIVDRAGDLHELSEIPEMTAIAALSVPITKHYVFAPKDLTYPSGSSI